jgi:hypothetical protein
VPAAHVTRHASRRGQNGSWSFLFRRLAAQLTRGESGRFNESSYMAMTSTQGATRRRSAEDLLKPGTRSGRYSKLARAAQFCRGQLSKSNRTSRRAASQFSREPRGPRSLHRGCRPGAERVGYQSGCVMLRSAIRPGEPTDDQTLPDPSVHLKVPAGGPKRPDRADVAQRTNEQELPGLAECEEPRGEQNLSRRDELRSTRLQRSHLERAKPPVERRTHREHRWSPSPK